MENKPQKIQLVNVGIVDIRKASADTLGEVSMVNVGMVLHSRETAGLLKVARSINVGKYVEVPPESTVMMETTVLSESYLKIQPAPLDLVAFGPVIISSDVTEATLDQNLSRLSFFNGPLICPERLAGLLRSRIYHSEGSTILYNSTQVQITMGKLILDETYLHSLDNGSELIVVGPLRLPQVLPNDLLEQKIQRLHTFDGIVCHEENVAFLRTHLDDGTKKMKIIPAGFELLETPLRLGPTELESLPARKLYCTEWVQIDPEVTSAALDAHLEALISEAHIFCPAALKEAIFRKCDWRKNRLTLYKGELWLVENDWELPAYAFERLTDKATLVVFGELTLDPEIAPHLLAERLDRVHNLGEIQGTGEQLEALRTRLGIQEGELEDGRHPDHDWRKSLEKEEEEEKGKEKTSSKKRQYVNVAYVAL